MDMMHTLFEGLAESVRANSKVADIILSRKRQEELAAEKIRDDVMEALSDEGKLPWGRTVDDCPQCGRKMPDGSGGRGCHWTEDDYIEYRMTIEALEEENE